MLPSTDNITVFLGSVVLALLSIYTIEKCRKDSTAHLKNPALFLFKGKTRMYALSSNLGAIFSVTYFFGATFIYGHIFRGGLILVLVTLFAILFWLIPAVLVAAHRKLPQEKTNDEASNILLEYLKACLSRSDFKLLVKIYALIYFSLLVEELAVSRLVLSTLFSFHPAITTIMLCTVCFVIVAYLYFGGFRAVLISDYEQLKVVAPFAAMLVFLIARDSRVNVLASLVEIPKDFTVGGGFLAVIFGLSWYAAGVDFYSRLNFFVREEENILKARKEIVNMSLAAMFMLLLVGIVFGEHLVGIFPRFNSPSDYTKASVFYFLDGSRITAAVFFIGLFCMIFTTLNVLMLTLLQIGYYFTHPLLGRKRLVQMLLAAVVISTVIRFDAVSAVGVFIGSLLVIPFAVVMSTLHPRAGFISADLSYLKLALGSAVIIFALCFQRLENDFRNHFFIPGIVLGSLIASFLVGKGLKIIREIVDNA